MKKILFPGSFDPFTVGHASLVERALTLFDEVIVALGINENKTGWLTTDQRYLALSRFYHDNPRVSVTLYRGATVDCARRLEAAAILRGVRSLKDFEYELQMAQMNRVIAPDVDTLFLTTNLKYAYLSSSMVKEVARYGGDISEFVNARIAELVQEKLADKRR